MNNHDATPGAPDHPAQLGPFVIESVLGRGAFGTVYRGIDPRTQRTLAIKILHRSNLSPFTMRRLQAEEEALRSLEDDSFPWFPRVVESGRFDGVPYLAMEYVAGGRIDAFCDARQLDIHSRVSLFRLVCLAIQKAHQHGVLHLDLKPAHVLVQEGFDPKGGPTPRIIDLGLAQGVDRALVLDESTYGAPLGTPGFMSPEVAAGKKGDARSDVYALGIVLYWLLTGCKPREVAEATSGPGGASAHRPDEVLPRPDARWQEAMRKEPTQAVQISARRAESPASLHRALRSDLGTIVMRAVEPDPKRRYQDPGELAADLERYLEHRPIPGRHDWLYRARFFVRRNRTAVGVLTGAVAAMVALIVMLGTNLAQAKEIMKSATAEQLANATSLLRSGEMAAQRGRWREALDLYEKAERSGYTDSLELGILRVEAYEACFETARAQQMLDALVLRPDSGRRRASLLLLQADLRDSPDAHLDDVRTAIALADADPNALMPVDREYAKSLLAETPREALDCLRRARTHDASNYRVNCSYAMTMMCLGDLDGVIPFAALFQALNPDDEEANYLSVAILALGNRRAAVDDAIGTVRAKFGDAAGDLAEEAAETMNLIGWGNTQMRSQLTQSSASLSTLVWTVASLAAKVSSLQRAIAERREERTTAGRFEALVRMPPSVARCYGPLLQIASSRPFRPQAIGAALAHLQSGQVDGGLLYFHAMGLVFDEKPREALARLEQALQTPSIWIDRRTMLLFGCLLGAKTIDEWPATPPSDARESLRTKVLAWVQEAGGQEDWTPREMLCFFETAMLLKASNVAVPIGHKWYSLAPKDYRIRIAHAEVLALEGAVPRADALLGELEANQQEADAAAKIRLADVRRLVDKLKKR